MAIERRKYIVTPLGGNMYENNFVDTCRNCCGTGLIKLLTPPGLVEECPVCLGSGEVAVTKRIEVIVKPFKRQSNDTEQKRPVLG